MGMALRLHRRPRIGMAIFVGGFGIHASNAAVVVGFAMLGVAVPTAGVWFRAALRVAAGGQQVFKTFFHALVHNEIDQPRWRDSAGGEIRLGKCRLHTFSSTSFHLQSLTLEARIFHISSRTSI